MLFSMGVPGGPPVYSICFAGGSINPMTGRPFSTRYYDILSTRRTLPVWQAKEKFIELLHANQTMVLIGETGSGKTTQIAQVSIHACLPSP